MCNLRLHDSRAGGAPRPVRTRSECPRIARARWGGARRSVLRFASMITSMHLLIYSDDAPATRAFLRDVLGLPFVEDAGPEPGWLIFGTGRSELGVHPTHSVWE